MHLAISNKNKNTTQNGMQFQGDLSFSRSGRWETRRANQKDSSLRMETMKTGFLWICAMDCATWLLSCQIRILFMLHNSLKGSSSYIQTFTFEKMYSNLLDFLLSPPICNCPESLPCCTGRDRGLHSLNAVCSLLLTIENSISQILPNYHTFIYNIWYIYFYF